MGKKVIFFCILFSLILISFASAQENAGGVYSKQGAEYMDSGLIINTLMYHVIPMNKDFTVYMTPYEISGKTLDNSSIDCRFGLVNPDGSRLYLLEQANFTIISNNDIWVATIPGSFLYESGRYLFNWDCQQTIKGGYFVGHVDVTYSGEVITEGQAILSLGFLTLLVLIFIINFVGMGFLPPRNKTDEEGRLLSISYLKYFRNTLWMTGYFLFIGITYIASNLAFAFLSEQLIAKSLFMVFRVSFVLAPVVLIVWIIWIFVTIFHDKQFQSLLNRGIFPGGNL